MICTFQRNPQRDDCYDLQPESSHPEWLNFGEQVADAAFAEDLNAALGALATTRPLLFLRETARSGQGCDVVTVFWTDYSGPEASAEKKLRLERLQQPVPAALKSLRAKCVQLLRSSP